MGFLIIAVAVVVYLTQLRKIFSSEHTEPETELMRDLVLLFSSAASFFVLAWAVLAGENSKLLFAAGLLGLLALRTTGVRFTAHKIQGKLWPALVNTMTRPLLICTVIAGLYSIPVLFLEYGLETGSITLRQLKGLDRLAVHARILFGRFQPTAILSLTLVVLFVLLSWGESSWSRCPSRDPRLPRRIFCSGMKWMTRVTIAALLLISLLSVAALRHEPDIAAAIHEFKHRYAELWGSIEDPLERVIQQELIAKTWAQLDEND
jgi:hypothetical protein